ncbi:class I SAM-dependent methyltransferase [Marinicrinis lubricantis]
MLAKLGVGNAHPGGYGATLEQLKHWPIAPGSRVLEVGCGTGRTACHLARNGCVVTALDFREDMLAKAVKRAAEEGVSVHFVQGDARRLPFAAHGFDVVFLESVTLFAGVYEPVKEYYRVLKSGGALYDREMMALNLPSPELLYEAKDLYGFDMLPTQQEWLRIFEQAGFREVLCWNPGKLSQKVGEDESLYPDFGQTPDQDTLINPELWQTALRYHQMIEKYGDDLGYGLFVSKK